MLLMNEIVVFYYTCVIWRPGECESLVWNLYVCMCGIWFTDDIVIDDINWYEMTLVFMIILIWDDVIIVGNVIEMRGRWCW